ncbi:hypothetical protein B0G52_104145 [Cohnella sp. SGD-V74]|uniref:hypothetical protein n=1 Tax=unclassified Cohnella TaxID=2636738 RepID=UPI000D4E308A|nr:MULTISPECIES: hypothetical protein [unclassified Cohnella]PRX73045.1 hypothetical protein B0G52_104145 [Cohnella sp. SGD-V74]
MKVTDKDFRKMVQSELRKIRRAFPKNLSDELGIGRFHLSLLDDMTYLIKDRHAESRLNIKNNEELSKQSQLALIGLISVGYLCLAIDLREDSSSGRTLLPADFIKPEVTVDPNLIIRSFLVQIVNHGLSILELVNCGLDNSARVLVRVLNETSWLSLVLFSSRTKLIQYSSHINDPEKEKEIWRKSFSLGQLTKELINLESRFGLPNDIVRAIGDTRNELYRAYSQSIHSSYVPTVLGSFGLPFSNSEDEIMSFSLFGTATKASNGTLEDLNWCLFYYHLMFFAITKEIHKYKATPHNELWRAAYALSICYRHIYLSEYKKKFDE